MLEPGTQIGRYEVQRRLGSGGMGAVYVAHDPRLGRMVAVKVFAGDLELPDARERFEREARAAAALKHPRIVVIHDFGEYEARPYIVMEYVQGETLAQVMRRRASVSPDDKLRWIEELCDGIGYAHSMSLIHRDIKPANLMVDRAGRLKILDFGIARMLGMASNTMAAVGTPGYMAPEQLQGRNVDHRADLFSIGAVLYELMAGRVAFPGETVHAVHHNVLSATPPRLTEAGPAVAAIVERLLEKEPAARYQDADTLRADIAAARRDLEGYGAAEDLGSTVIRPVERPRPSDSGSAQVSVQKDDAPEAPRRTPPEWADSVTVTPSPQSGQWGDRRPRTDVDEAARLRRETHVQAALDRARALYAQRDFEAALDACLDALAYDQGHLEALALTDAVRRGLETDHRGTSPSGRTPQPLPKGGTRDLGATVPPTPVPGRTAPGQAPAAPPVPTAATRSQESRQPDGARRSAGSRSGRSQKPSRPPGLPFAERLRKQMSQGAAVLNGAMASMRSHLLALDTRLRALPRVQQQRLLAAVAGGLVLLVGAGGVALWPAAEIPVGTVLVDAVPWGIVVAIEAEDGTTQELPPDSSTPLRVTLPIGAYVVTVQGPPPESRVERVTVEIREAGMAGLSPVRFAGMSVEEYFEPYLTAQQLPGEADATAPGAAEGTSDAGGATASGDAVVP